MMLPLLEVMNAKHQRDQLYASHQMARQQAAYRNYVDYHGHPPPVEMSVVRICAEYSRPWRKTHIPKAGTPKLPG